MKINLSKISFKRFIIESKSQLDISIMSAKKYLSSDDKKDRFLSSLVTVEHKTDGIKITLIKKDSTGIAENDWIVSYKGNIIYPKEFEFLSKSQIKKNSINNAQISIVWEHLQKLSASDTKKIPKGTELFVEFLMNKPTLSSNYTKKHGMVLIGHSKSTWKEKQGKLFTKPNGFFTERRDEYAKYLKLDTPAVLFKGILGTEREFSKGIKDKSLKSLFLSSDINWDNEDSIINGISQMFLDVESKYGGKEEGVVIKGPDFIIKFQQEYQLDQEARFKIKQKYRGTIEQEDQYWKEVNSLVDKIIKGVSSKSLEDALKEVSKYLQTIKDSELPQHVKKNKIQIIEDIQITARMRIFKKLPGNQGALFLGKMRILTKAHYNIIREGIAKYDTMTIALVSSSDTRGTKKLRNEVLKHCFPEVEILNVNSGNIFNIINRAQNNINYVLAGSDRVESYRKMLSKNRDMEVVETKRTDEDISASKIIERIDDYEYFKENTPECVWKFYEEYLKNYK